MVQYVYHRSNLCGTAECAVFVNGRCDLTICNVCSQTWFYNYKTAEGYIHTAKVISHLQSGPKVLEHSRVFIRDFPRSPFSMLSDTILARMPLLSATLRHGVGRGNSILRQEFGITIPSHHAHNGQKTSF